MDLASLRARSVTTLCLLFVVGCSSGSATSTTTVELQPTAAATAATVRLTSLSIGPTDEVVTVEGIGGQSPLDLSGWVFRAGELTAVVPPGSVILPASHLTLHAASGLTTSRDVYVGLDTAAVADLLKPGVRVVLEDRSGVAISEMAVSR
jgi:hypothetical protein